MALSLVPLVPSVSTDEPFTLTGSEALVDRMRARAILLDHLAAEQAVDRTALLATVEAGRAGAKRVDVAAGGRPVRAADLVPDLVTTDRDPVPVSQVDSFKGVPLSHAGHLRAALGSRYADLFETVEVVSLRKGVTVEQLHAALGEALSLLSPLLDVVREVKPRKGWDATRARLRGVLDPGVDAGLDLFEGSHRADPKVRLR